MFIVSVNHGGIELTDKKSWLDASPESLTIRWKTGDVAPNVTALVDIDLIGFNITKEVNE